MSTTRPNGLSSTLRTRKSCESIRGRIGVVAGLDRHRPFAGASITVSVNVVPPPRRCVTMMSPPIARASCFTEDSPSPAPPKRDAIETLACENGRNSRLISASDRPMPLSETAKATPILPFGRRAAA